MVTKKMDENISYEPLFSLKMKDFCLKIVKDEFSLEDVQKILQNCAAEFSHNSNPQKKVVLFQKNNQPSIKEVFSSMDKDQSHRFIQEFIQDIIPHWKNKVETLKKINDKNDQIFLKGSILSKFLFKRLFQIMSDTSYLESVKNAIWVDDNEKTITIRSQFKL